MKQILDQLTLFFACLSLFFFHSLGYLQFSALRPLSSSSFSIGFSSSSNTRTFLARIENEVINIEDIQPGVMTFPNDLSDQWEVDCYSRPVMAEDGKKLWEVLVTDSTGSFRYLKPLASNLVNSRNLRKIMEDLIDSSPVKPKTIRFFRNQMFNMITIALSTLNVDVKPSRRTTNLCMWLQEREDFVYPRMKGYNVQLKQQSIFDYEVNQPDRMPDVLRAQSYAFVALPAEVFWSNQVNKENIKQGYLCPIREMPKAGWIHGVTLFSKRASSIAAWMNGLEIGSLKADLISRELLLNVDINTQYIVAPLQEKQKEEAQIFEQGKGQAMGYHFLSIQESPESDGVEGFWLLRQFGNNL